MQKKNQPFLRPLAQGAVLERLQAAGLYIHPKTNFLGEERACVWFAHVAIFDQEAGRLLESICRFWIGAQNQYGVEVECLGPHPDYEGETLYPPDDGVYKVSYLYRVPDGKAAWLAAWLRGHPNTPFDFLEDVVGTAHEERSC